MYSKHLPFNMRVEYDDIPVRHVAVQCPECEKWFVGYDIVEDGDSLDYDYQLKSATFRCPLCNLRFGCSTDYDNEKIVEVNGFDIYHGCMKKTVKWEE